LTSVTKGTPSQHERGEKGSRSRQPGCPEEKASVGKKGSYTQAQSAKKGKRLPYTRGRVPDTQFDRGLIERRRGAYNLNGGPSGKVEHQKENVGSTFFKRSKQPVRRVGSKSPASGTNRITAGLRRKKCWIPKKSRIREEGPATWRSVLWG